MTSIGCLAQPSRPTCSDRAPQAANKTVTSAKTQLAVRRIAAKRLVESVAQATLETMASLQAHLRDGEPPQPGCLFTNQLPRPGLQSAPRPPKPNPPPLCGMTFLATGARGRGGKDARGSAAGHIGPEVRQGLQA